MKHGFIMEKNKLKKEKYGDLVVHLKDVQIEQKNQVALHKYK